MAAGRTRHFSFVRAQKSSSERGQGRNMKGMSPLQLQQALGPRAQPNLPVVGEV